MHKKTVVAVCATQSGATFASFDNARFAREVIEPVRAFLAKVENASCVLYFYGGLGVGAEEARDEKRCEEGLPHHKVTPSYCVARTAFSKERAVGTVDLLVLTGARPLPDWKCYIEGFLQNSYPGTEPHIVTPDFLEELALEKVAHLMS